MRRMQAVFLLILGLLALPAVAADTVYYIHTDALGSPVAMTDANRNVVERTQYAPYGQVLNRPEHDGPGYTGHEEDSATGLTNMQQRYDDKVVGRFLSVDPVQPDGNTGGSFNRYAYASDNPYKFTDPDGREDKKQEEDEGQQEPGVGCTGSATGKGCDSQSVRVTVYDNSYRKGTSSNSQTRGSAAAGSAAAGAARSGAFSKPTRQSSKTLRQKWEDFWNEKWPWDEKMGRNQDVAHYKAVSEGGDPNDVKNYRPLPHDEHVREHQENGDFKRWGSWSRAARWELGPARTGPDQPPPTPEEMMLRMMADPPLIEE